MIIEDKEDTITKAHEFSSELLKLISENTKTIVSVDDPAEQIYFSCHVVASLLAKISISLEEYGKIYAIEFLNAEKIKEWINAIAKEYSEIWSDVNNEPA